MRYEILHLVRVFLVLCLLAWPIVELATPDAPESPYRERSQTTSYTPSAQDELCLTQAVYYEAGNQSVMGKEAVAWVVVNRVGRRGYPKTVCGVIAQSRRVEETKVCQFSFWCEKRYKPNKTIWKESSEVAHRVLQNIGIHVIIDQYGEATYFHARYVHPSWAKHMKRLGKIQDHIFYKEKR